MNPRTHPPDIDGLRDRVLSPAPLTRLGYPRPPVIISVIPSLKLFAALGYS